MNLMMSSSFIAILIPLLVYFIAKMLAMRSFADREKLSSFECGFDLNSSARVPFSLRFFLLAIIFIIFDIEIVLLMPIPLLLKSSSFLMISSLLIMILLVGLLYEWFEGSLDWMN